MDLVLVWMIGKGILADSLVDADTALEFVGYGAFLEDEDGAGIGMLLVLL